MSRTKIKKTVKTLRIHVCEFRGEELVKIAVRERFYAAYRLKLRHPGSFIVNECVAIDESASDLGTVYWFDERGESMEKYF